jgi:hypothetical protein
MPRGSHMVLEVAAEVPSIAEYVSGITGTFTELLSQPQPPMSPGRCRSLTARAVDRLYLKGWLQFRSDGARFSIPSFFVVITTFSETVWTQLTVLILDYLVPWVSHSGRRQGTKDDQKDVFEVTGGT